MKRSLASEFHKCQPVLMYELVEPWSLRKRFDELAGGNPYSRKRNVIVKDNPTAAAHSRTIFSEFINRLCVEVIRVYEKQVDVRRHIAQVKVEIIRLEEPPERS